MNKQEALGLIFYTAEKWGAAAALPEDEGRLDTRVIVWMDALGDLSADVVRAAIASASTEFPPNVIQLRRIVDDLTGRRPTLPDWDEFWRWVRDEASRASLYALSTPPYLDCPWDEMTGVLTAPILADWSRSELSTRDLELVQQAHMRRLFDARVNRVERETLTPAPAVVAFLEGQPRQLRRASEVEELQP